MPRISYRNVCFKYGVYIACFITVQGKIEVLCEGKANNIVFYLSHGFCFMSVGLIGSSIAVFKTYHAGMIYCHYICHKLL